MSTEAVPDYDVLFNIAERHFERFTETWDGELTDESRHAFIAGWFNGNSAAHKDRKAA